MHDSPFIFLPPHIFSFFSSLLCLLRFLHIDSYSCFFPFVSLVPNSKNYEALLNTTKVHEDLFSTTRVHDDAFATSRVYDTANSSSSAFATTKINNTASPQNTADMSTARIMVDDDEDDDEDVDPFATSVVHESVTQVPPQPRYSLKNAPSMRQSTINNNFKKSTTVVGSGNVSPRDSNNSNSNNNSSNSNNHSSNNSNNNVMDAGALQRLIDVSVRAALEQQQQQFSHTFKQFQSDLLKQLDKQQQHQQQQLLSTLSTFSPPQSPSTTPSETPVSTPPATPRPPLMRAPSRGSLRLEAEPVVATAQTTEVHGIFEEQDEDLRGFIRDQLEDLNHQKLVEIVGVIKRRARSNAVAN